MGDVASQTDAALHALQAMLNSTASTAGDLFQGMTAALGGATSAAAQDVVDGTQQIQDFLIGALADSFGSLQGVRGDISQSAAAAQDALSIVGAPLLANLSRSAAVAGFTAAGSSLQGTTGRAYNDVGSAAVALNDTLGQFGREVLQLVRRISLPNPAAGLAAAVKQDAGGCGGRGGPAGHPGQLGAGHPARPTPGRAQRIHNALQPQPGGLGRRPGRVPLSNCPGARSGTCPGRQARRLFRRLRPPPTGKIRRSSRRSSRLHLLRRPALCGFRSRPCPAWRCRRCPGRLPPWAAGHSRQQAMPRTWALSLGALYWALRTNWAL